MAPKTAKAIDSKTSETWGKRHKMIVDDVKLVSKLRALQQRAEAEANVSVAVGYTAAYALALHEDKEATLMGRPRPYKGTKSKTFKSGKRKGQKRPGIGVYWGPSLYGPNYLVGPARENSARVANAIRNSYARGATLLESLAVGGAIVQRESQKAVPAEFGFLRESAFTEKES